MKKFSFTLALLLLLTIQVWAQTDDDKSITGTWEFTSTMTDADGKETKKKFQAVVVQTGQNVTFTSDSSPMKGTLSGTRLSLSGMSVLENNSMITKELYLIVGDDEMQGSGQWTLSTKDTHENGTERLAGKRLK
jgi:hypothetical protein